LKTLLEFGGIFHVVRNVFGKSNLIKFISQFWKLGMKDIDFWMNFVVEDSNKLKKLGLKGRISQALDMFILGPIAHATLIRIKDAFIPTFFSQNGHVSCIE